MLAGYRNQVEALKSSLNDERMKLEQFDAAKKQLEIVRHSSYKLFYG